MNLSGFDSAKVMTFQDLSNTKIKCHFPFFLLTPSFPDLHRGNSAPLF